jgi:hypothetical protein
MASVNGREREGTAGTNGFHQRLLLARFYRAHQSYKLWSNSDEAIVIGPGPLGCVRRSGAAAATVNLTGTYRCVQMCRDGALGAPTFVTQNGDAVNLTTEAGESLPGLARLERPQ